VFSGKLYSPEDPKFKYLHETERGCNGKFFSPSFPLQVYFHVKSPIVPAWETYIWRRRLHEIFHRNRIWGFELDSYGSG